MERILKIIAVILSIIIVVLSVYIVQCGARFDTKSETKAETIKESTETEKWQETANFETGEAYEQETEQKVDISADNDGLETDVETVQETVADERVEVEAETQDQVDRIQRMTDFGIPAEIYDEMEARLKANNIEWWLPYMIAQCFQESMFRVDVENGLDKGLLQYRITYWSAICVEHGYPADTSIFDWRTQIAIYTMDTARRLNSGLSIEETISRHKQSDFGQYDALYVSHVMRWVR